MAATRARGWLIVLLTGGAIAHADGVPPAPVVLGSDAAVAAARPHVAQGEALFRDGKFEEALVELRAGYALDPRPELLVSLARTEQRLDRVDEALADCERFLARSSSPPLVAEVKRLRKELRGERARASARAAAADGAAAFGAGDYERALAAYQRAYMDDIDEPQYLVRLADCYRALARTPDALRFYRLYLHERPDAPERASIEATIAALEHPAAVARAPSLALDGHAARDTRRPVWRRWWFWTALGGVAAVGVGLGVGLGTRSSAGSFSPTLPAFGPSGQTLLVVH